MKGKTQVRVFRYRRRYRIVMAVLTAAMLALALFSTYKVVTAGPETVFARFLIQPWFVTVYLTYKLIRSQRKIIVSDDSISYSNLFRAFRIPFSEVTEFDSSNSHLRIRSKKHRIHVGRWFADVHTLAELVKERLAEIGKTRSGPFDADTREQKVFRYARGFKWFVRLELAGMILIVVLFFLMRPEEFQWGWVICMSPFIACIPIALYVLYRTITTVEFLDDFLYWQRGRRAVTVPYNAIEQAVVKKTWLGRPYREIRWDGKRLRLPAALVPFDRLVAQLSRRTTVSWAGRWPLQFPVEMQGSWWFDQTIFSLMGLFFTALAVYEGFDRPPGNWFSLLVAVAGSIFGIALIVLGTLLQYTNDSPRGIQIRRRKILFGRHRFAIVDLFKCRTYRARDVTQVILRVDNDIFTEHILVIEVAEKRFVLYNLDRNIPLVPLYQLLCQAYHPEGYRDPLALEGEDHEDAHAT